MLKGIVAGGFAGVIAHLQGNSARAQCTWTGTWQTTFGGITMPLTEAAGQVSGAYTFTENGVQTSGTITGVVRTDTPGYTVLDGYWREPVEGGRLWFTMAEPCTNFAGWYTSTDVSEDWIAGWDGVRSDGGQPPPTGTADATYYINPGDSRAAQIIMDGQTGTFFGPKDPDGGVQYINQALLTSADGDPEKEVLLEFDSAGAPTRATLARGDRMSFEWLSPTSVIITYMTPDGSQEVRFPYEGTPPATWHLPGHSRHHAAGLGGAGRGRRLAYTGRPNPSRALAGSRQAPAVAQPLSSPGVLEVRCGAGELIGGAVVTGEVVAVNLPGTPAAVSFTELITGRFDYSLPIAPAPPPGEGFHRTRVSRALTIICLGNTAMLLTQASKGFICATLLGIPAAGTVGFVACETALTAYIWACRANFAATVGGVTYDFFAGSFQVTARVQHPKFGSTSTTFNVSAGTHIPVQVVEFPGAAAIADVTIETAGGGSDPAPGEAYTIRATTICVPAGSLLTINMIGSDQFPASTSVTIDETISEATLEIPGASEGVFDTITVTLTGALIVPDETTITVTF